MEGVPRPDQMESAMGDAWSTASSEYGSKSPQPQRPTDGDGSRSPIKPDTNTYDHIFGDQSDLLRKKERVYHMSSDIFGVGSMVDRDRFHIQENGNGYGPAAPRSQESPQISTEDAVYVHDNGVEPAESQDGMDHLDADMPEKRGNARDNGSNPVTGAGYSQESSPSKSQRRHYPQAQSTSFW